MYLQLFILNLSATTLKIAFMWWNLMSHMEKLFMHMSKFLFKNQWSWQTAKVFQRIETSLSISETFPPRKICNICYMYILHILPSKFSNGELLKVDGSNYNSKPSSCKALTNLRFQYNFQNVKWLLKIEPFKNCLHTSPTHRYITCIPALTDWSHNLSLLR